jgi:hypothetical protein
MSAESESRISELSRLSFSMKSLVWNAVLATAVIIAIVALIATQPQPEAIDYLAGNALP